MGIPHIHLTKGNTIGTNLVKKPSDADMAKIKTALLYLFDKDNFFKEFGSDVQLSYWVTPNQTSVPQIDMSLTKKIKGVEIKITLARHGVQKAKQTKVDKFLTAINHKGYKKISVENEGSAGFPVYMLELTESGLIFNDIYPNSIISGKELGQKIEEIFALIQGYSDKAINLVSDKKVSVNWNWFEQNQKASKGYKIDRMKEFRAAIR